MGRGGEREREGKGESSDNREEDKLLILEDLLSFALIPHLVLKEGISMDKRMGLNFSYM